MGINLITFYNSTVTPPDDALIYEKALPGSGMIYGGTVTIKNANTLHVAAGHGALCGRKFTIEETDITVVLTSSGTLNGRLYIHMDLSDTDEPISFQVERAATLTPVIQQDNVNINDGIYEINLATFTISTSTVSDLVNVAPFIDDEVLETIIAPVEFTSTASRNYSVGAHLIYKKVLYRVTSAITTGGTITPGSNVTVSNSIENQIEDLSGTKTNQTVIATRQANLTASRAYAVGDQFIYNNILYKATAAIASGAAITIGGNATAADNIVSQISNLSKVGSWQDVKNDMNGLSQLKPRGNPPYIVAIRVNTRGSSPVSSELSFGTIASSNYYPPYDQYIYCGENKYIRIATNGTIYVKGVGTWTDVYGTYNLAK